MSEDTAGKKAKPQTAAQIEADLKAKRAELANTVDALTAQLDPRQNLNALKSQLADTAANASEEAQDFITRVQSGDRRAADALGLTLMGLAAVAGVILIRRCR